MDEIGVIYIHIVANSAFGKQTIVEDDGTLRTIPRQYEQSFSIDLGWPSMQAIGDDPTLYHAFAVYLRRIDMLRDHVEQEAQTCSEVTTA